jgi:D-glycero-alpha-D-manno-heptose-7-phosphate kinase
MYLRPATAPLRIINSTAPIRIADNGGWSDTWFAVYGKVFQIAVSPFAEVQVRVHPQNGKPDRITIHAENYGERYSIPEPRGQYDKHPLLEAALDEMGVPDDIAIDVSIYSDAPAGCSTGTSASVSVALLGALARLHPEKSRMTPHDIAMAAQSLETNRLGQQCGIQDQLAAAYGGVNLIEMDRYPHARVIPLRANPEFGWDLENRLLLVYLGEGHNSSEVHRMVIRELEGEGPESPRLARIRRCAEMAAEAYLDHDMTRLGLLMTENTEAQGFLHHDLIGPHHLAVIEIAKEFGAFGWKVNGAGGKGGSVTILCGADYSVRREMMQAILAANPAYRIIPITMQRHGLRVWES